jgi:hypothetical protein
MGKGWRKSGMASAHRIVDHFREEMEKNSVNDERMNVNSQGKVGMRQQWNIVISLIIGECIENGRGVEKDVIRAVEDCNCSAEQGRADRQCNFSLCLWNAVVLRRP